jgi:hypothetical protein
MLAPNVRTCQTSTDARGHGTSMESIAP